MIVQLPDTTTSAISRAMVKIRDEGGAVALGRVLTLIIRTMIGEGEEAIEAALQASREHPMRVIVLATERDRASADGQTSPRLDAEIRTGGDEGASEVIVLEAYGAAASDEEALVTGLLLPDAPVVVWWPADSPECVADSSLGALAQRRITDAANQDDPIDALVRLSRTYTPGDTDLSWTRLTLWRGQLAAVLDQPPYEPVTGATVEGALDSPSTLLLAAWLGYRLDVPAVYGPTDRGRDWSGIYGVQLERQSGQISLERDITSVATLKQPGQPAHELALPRRSLDDCLAEELRRLRPDEEYGAVVTRGVPKLLAEREQQ